MTHIVQSTDYSQVSDALRREIAVMLQRVWPDSDSLPEGKYFQKLILKNLMYAHFIPT